jgi:hypothetical protein
MRSPGAFLQVTGWLYGARSAGLVELAGMKGGAWQQVSGRGWGGGSTAAARQERQRGVEGGGSRILQQVQVQCFRRSAGIE